PGSLPRFYKLFTLAFTAYVIVWSMFWIWLRSDVGEFAGLLGGMAAMGTILALAFDARLVIVKTILALSRTYGLKGQAPVVKTSGMAKKPLKQNESLKERVESDLSAIKAQPKLVRSFFGASSVVYAKD